MVLQPPLLKIVEYILASGFKNEKMLSTTVKKEGVVGQRHFPN